jgi:Sec-independent protein secretion pathway components
MFDFGFSELIVIGIVLLVVVGPERLPKVARTAGICSVVSSATYRTSSPTSSARCSSRS